MPKRVQEETCFSGQDPCGVIWPIDNVKQRDKFGAEKFHQSFESLSTLSPNACKEEEAIQGKGFGATGERQCKMRPMIWKLTIHRSRPSRSLP